MTHRHYSIDTPPSFCEECGKDWTAVVDGRKGRARRRAAQAPACSEDELLQAVTDALTLTGWRWTHSRRSDRAITQGHQGVPDIIAARGTQLLAWELKSAKGRVSPEQQLWLNAWQDVGADARVVRPADLDDVLRIIEGRAS